jgi:hypothetical protein
MCRGQLETRDINGTQKPVTTVKAGLKKTTRNRNVFKGRI